MADVISQHTSTTDDFHQLIETTKHALYYTIPREYREPVAPVARRDDHDNTTSRYKRIAKFLFRWPLRSKRLIRRQRKWNA
jgi:hypothetical protein